MSIVRESAQHVSAFVFGCTGVALSVGGAGAIAATGGAALIGIGLAAVYEKRRSHAVEDKTELKRIIRRTTEDWRSQPAFRKHDPGRDLSDASDALIRYLPMCNMSRERLVACAAQAPGLPFPDAATDLVIAELAGHAPDIYAAGGPALAADFARAVIRAAFTAAIENRAYYEKLEPYLLLKVAETQGLSISLLTDLADEVQDVKAGVQGVSQQISDLPAAIRDMLVQAGMTGGLSKSQTETILSNFGHENVPAELWEAKLKASAQELADLKMRLTTLTNDEPEITNLLQRAKEAIDSADFGKADALLAEAEHRDREEGERRLQLAARSREEGERRLQRAARSREQRGDLAQSAGREVDAAEHYAEAARMVRGLDSQEWARLKFTEGRVLAERGQYDPEPYLLMRAADAYREALKEYRRELAPLDWAATQNNLGITLQTLGERGNDGALQEAIAAYQDALKERTRERVPLDWAATQNNLGNALRVLGGRGDDSALQGAIAAFQETLKEYTRERVPLDWAVTQNNLGTALAILGERGNDIALQEAVAAFHEALNERTRERVPLDWAATQNNLGNVLHILGKRGDDGALQDAVASYREALRERTRERVPLGWAMTQNNLGNALQALGERGDDAALQDSVSAFREALKERTRERVPLDWAGTQNNLGTALRTLGERGDDAALQDAVTAFQEALTEYTRERVPLGWAMIQNNLGNALLTLGERGDDVALEQAIGAYRLAREELTAERTPYQHGVVSRNLAETEALLKARREGTG